MTAPIPVRTPAGLRGRLPAESLGARGLEHLGRNPDCTRLQTLAVASLSPATAAREIYGEPVREGQSPFAIQAGNGFEAHLLKDNARRLVERLVAEGLIPPEPCVAIVEGKNREAMTAQIFARKARRDPEAPHLLVKPRLPLTLLGEPQMIEPDFVYASDADPFYRPGEVKSYPDREGKTDPADIRGACRQAAVGIQALREAATRHGLPASTVEPRGVLVLRKPGTRIPTLRPMTLEGEVHSLERTIGRVSTLFADITTHVPAGQTLENPAVLDAIPNSYRASCREHCALAARCRAGAQRLGSPAVLGDTVQEQLAPVRTIGRALQLIHGTGCPPIDPAEQRLGERLQLAATHYEGAIHHVA